MLVVTRNQGQRIIINDNIVVTILGCEKQVKVGIEAPEHISIDREELYLRKLANPNFKEDKSTC